ncbi:MAG: SatD family protein [Porticoccaceae bacterium]|nr:SatD family protein [Porticoccaceae bacterium]
MNYLALIGDICDSRKVQDRGQLQETLRRVLDQLNLAHDRALSSPFTITLGDEFQALLSTAVPLWQMIAAIQNDLFPVRVRFGMGLGRIDTAINREAALGMDGSAFHLARDAMGTLKKDGGLFRIEGLPRGELANHSLALVAHLQGQWQHNRFAVYRGYLAGQPVQGIAEALGISKVAVYKNINDGLLETISGISTAISANMDDMLAGNHGV